MYKYIFFIHFIVLYHIYTCTSHIHAICIDVSCTHWELSCDRLHQIRGDVFTERCTGLFCGAMETRNRVCVDIEHDPEWRRNQYEAIRARLWSVFERLDKDGGGDISLDELIPEVKNSRELSDFLGIRGHRKSGKIERSCSFPVFGSHGVSHLPGGRVYPLIFPLHVEGYFGTWTPTGAGRSTSRPRTRLAGFLRFPFLTLKCCSLGVHALLAGTLRRVGHLVGGQHRRRPGNLGPSAATWSP